ncbi:hypothetical protein ZIOFF_033899 [Zingiber officinale]|uniref:Uncharacterized protein n=1 Tax=Zingiber officinale TaxID=94328 RepID=A0A8J5GPY2_ZINOF|nr:hypothetical protein ZIOFF_033899 [Zingiber officinale]
MDLTRLTRDLGGEPSLMAWNGALMDLTRLARDLGGEPPHDMERCLDEFDCQFHQDGDAEAAGADAREQQPATSFNPEALTFNWLYLPDDPDEDADDGEEEGEEGEGEAEQPTQRPALAVAVAAHPSSFSLDLRRFDPNSGGNSRLTCHGDARTMTVDDVLSSEKWHVSKPHQVGLDTRALNSLFPKLITTDEPLMAAIEARVLWHRTANHCPVQEDATLASSPSSTEKHDSSGADTTSVPEEESFLESPRMVWTDLMKDNSKTLVKEISMTTNYPQQPLKRKADMNFAYKKEELLVLKLDEQLPSRRIDKTSELGSPWATINKSEPWWRSTDKDDLYLLVAQKSLLRIENCDLPKPTQIIGINKQADDNGVFQSSLDRNPTTGMCDANEYSHDTPSSGRLNNKDIPPRQRCYGEHDSRKFKILWSYAVTTEAVQKIDNLKAIRQLRSLTLRELSCWKHFDMPKHEPGKLTRQPKKLTGRRNIRSNCY